MVWQDFPLACAAYPEEEPHRSEFEAEAREHVARLSAHPSLVIWNGGNENLWGFEDWGWQETLDGGRGARATTTTSSRRSWPSSTRRAPTPPAARPRPPASTRTTRTTARTTSGRSGTASTTPRTAPTSPASAPSSASRARPPGPRCERAVRNADGAPLAKEDPVFLLHQKADDGNGKLDRGMAPHLGVPTEFSDWHWATQLNQARAVAHAITHYRSWWPRTAGAIVWQLNDCWPVTSWAAVDGDERRKPLWHALRASFADRILTVQERDGLEVLAAVNDSDRRWDGSSPSAANASTAPGSPMRSSPSTYRRARSRSSICPTTSGPARPARRGARRRARRRATAHTWLDDVDLDLDPEPLQTQRRAGRRTATG